MTGSNDEKAKPKQVLPHVQTVSAVDMTMEEVENSIPEDAGTVLIEANNAIITVRSENMFDL